MYVSLLMNYILFLSMPINSNVSWLYASRHLQNYKFYVHVYQLKLVGKSTGGNQPLQQLKRYAIILFHALQVLTRQELKQLRT